MSGYLPRNDYLKLKAAMKRLVTLCGGTRECHDINGDVRHQRYSEWASPKHPDAFPTARAIADLESFAEQPVITEALAGLLGYVLVKLPDPGERQSLSKGLGRVARECGDVISALGKALEDGKVDPDERKKLRIEIREAQTVLAEIDFLLEAMEFDIGEGTP